MWEARCGGKPSYGRLGKALKPLVDAHGEKQVLEAWSVYLGKTDVTFASAESFATKYRTYVVKTLPRLSEYA